MKFMMVMIICFAQDVCEAVFDDTVWYNSYDECVSTATGVAGYMKDAYPNSAGKIFCMTEEEASKYHDYIENGGVIELDLPDVDPEQTAI